MHTRSNVPAVILLEINKISICAAGRTVSQKVEKKYFCFCWGETNIIEFLIDILLISDRGLNLGLIC